MSNHRLVRKDHLILIAAAAAPMLIIASSLIGIDGYFSTPKIAYSQSDQDQMNSNTTNSVNIQDIPLEKVRVGDIDVAYKTFGKGEPILLFNGAGADMNGWEPSTLKVLSSNHTVIVSDYRGVGNTTTGSKPFSIQQFANDTAGLLDALKIRKADVLGYSMGSFVAQQLAITHPEKVNRLILVAASCGGKEGIPQSPQLQKMSIDMINKSLNNISVSQEEMKSLISATLGSGWIRLNPDSLETVPEAKDLFASITPNNSLKQIKAVQSWFATNWSGICSQLTKISNPTLVIVGTDDVSVPTANSLVIAGKTPGAWLVQIKDAGHAIPSQYPDKINRVLQTFLSVTTTSSS
jgi:pimeloyl-ACP methyl ester carboxylesterase